MRPLSIAEHSALIAGAFPSFREVFDLDFAGCWEGDLTPNAKTYRISILYFLPYVFDCDAVQCELISIRVVSPAIGLDPRGTGALPPHIYRDAEGGGFSLCLYDWREDEWRPELPISDTIIPWAAEWLFWFEAWLLTGVWSGGGTHPEKRGITCPTNNPSCPAPPARYRAAALDKVGRLTGTSASFPLMAAASVGCSLPRYWRISKRRSAQAPRSPITSI